jgi:hypothetical protein
MTDRSSSGCRVNMIAEVKRVAVRRSRRPSRHSPWRAPGSLAGLRASRVRGPAPERASRWQPSRALRVAARDVVDDETERLAVCQPPLRLLSQLGPSVRAGSVGGRGGVTRCGPPHGIHRTSTRAVHHARGEPRSFQRFGEVAAAVPVPEPLAGVLVTQPDVDGPRQPNLGRGALGSIEADGARVAASPYVSQEQHLAHTGIVSQRRAER